MRWTAVMVVVVACGGLLACGSDGDTAEYDAALALLMSATSDAVRGA